MKVFCEDFLYLQLVFVIFWQKKIGEKAAPKMLVKLTAVSAKGCNPSNIFTFLSQFLITLKRAFLGWRFE